jgi:hypothetical protein
LFISFSTSMFSFELKFEIASIWVNVVSLFMSSGIFY